MSRRQYVVTYDISDDKRRDKVFRTLHGYGDHAQYSVFLCELNDEEVTRLRLRLRGLIHHHEDQVLIIEMGTSSRPVETSIQVVGRPYQPAVRTLVV